MQMQTNFVAFVLFALLLLFCFSPSVVLSDDKAAKILIANSFQNANLSKLYYLCDTFGPRWPGTVGYTGALDWILEAMKEEGLENVHGETVNNIINWQRGRETLTMLRPRNAELSLLGLGMSVGTGASGITASVLVVTSFDDLTNRAADAKGKIVVFNVAFTSYGATVQYRSQGASAAAKVGAVAALVRSVTPYSLYSPHTGGMNYQSGIDRIPTAAITVEDAEMFGRMQARGQAIVLTLYMEAAVGTPVTEKNVIAELTGASLPRQIIVLGGHSDSWDVGVGAMDDGGGIYSAWDALSIVRDAVASGQLPRPKRTIRVVLWANEENGARGAIQYRADHLSELPNHVIAFESDSGNFAASGFGISDAPNSSYPLLIPTIKEAASYLASIGAGNLTIDSGAGRDVDNGYLYPDVACGSLESTGFSPENGDPRAAVYFNYHHSHADTVTALNPDGLRGSVAAFAVLIYYIANM